MLRLHEWKCKTIHSGDPALSDGDIIRLHPEAPKWEIKRIRSLRCLERVFTFSNFSEGIKFTNLIAESAKCEHHHPLIFIEYDSITSHGGHTT